jgi:Leucine-rich repeat (LRR) protein
MQLSGLISLQALHLNDNQISRLPESWAGLASLAEVHLQYNQLKRLPVQMGQLPALEVLELDGNPLPGPLLSLSQSSQQVRPGPAC